MIETTWILITVVSLLLSGFFSGTEMAFVTADKVRTAVDVRKGGFISRLVRRFYDKSEFFISTILVGNNIVLVVYGMGAAKMLEPWLETHFHSEFLVLLFQTLISTGVILLTGEFLPKTMFGINPNSSMRFLALPRVAAGHVAVARPNAPGGRHHPQQLRKPHLRGRPQRLSRGSHRHHGRDKSHRRK